jgi:hypothetical protein
MDALDGWSEFNVAMTGATAALAGLVIVAASVNIGEIVKARMLTARLAAGISGLVLAIIGSAIGLIPGISAVGYGASVTVLALAAGVFSVDATRQIYAEHHPQNRAKGAKAALAFVVPLVYLVAGALLLAGSTTGLIMLAVGAIAAIVAALLVSWIVLVEILR